MDDVDVLTTHDVARLIDRTTATVRKLDASGRLRAPIRTRGGQRLWRRADVEQYLRERDHQAA